MDICVTHPPLRVQYPTVHLSSTEAARTYWKAASAPKNSVEVFMFQLKSDTVVCV